MTSQVDLFLKKLQDSVQEKSISPTPRTTSPTMSGSSFKGASSTELATELGKILGFIVLLTLKGLVIFGILSLVDLGNFPFWQIAGLLLIWELVKPRLPSKG